MPASLGAFRFNTGALMRIGTAARLWDRLRAQRGTVPRVPADARRTARRLAGESLELCYSPFSMAEDCAASVAGPPATLLVLPNGWVKVAAALTAHLRRPAARHAREAWEAYRAAWRE